MTTDATIRTECPSCHAKFRVQGEHLGRRTRCPKCRQPFEIKLAGEAPPTAADDPFDQSPAVTHVGVNCRLCGTRMYGRLDQVGKPMKCPDCKTETLLPPPKPKAKNAVPAAMLGEQYELYEGDDQPWGVTLAASQAEMVPVHCELCGTLQYVPPEMVGSVAVCPDCDHGTRVRPAKPKPAPKNLGRDLELEPSSVTEEMATPSAPPLFSRLHEFESLSDEEKEERMSRVATNRKSRPQMPKLPLVTGWTAFLAGPGVVVRWLVLSLWFSGAAALAVFSFTLIFGGQYGAVAGLPLLCSAGAVAALCYAYSAAMAITIVTESSEGNDRMTSWPSINPIDWMGETIYTVIAALASAAPGYLLVQVTGAHPVAVIGGMLLSSWLLYPVMQLSSLEGSSVFALAMPGVLGSFSEHFGTWIMFYLLSGAVAGAMVLAVAALGWVGGPTLLAASVPIVGAAIVYFRLLGRLAWRIRDDD